MNPNYQQQSPNGTNAYAPMPPQKSKKPLFIAIAAGAVLVVAAIIVGIFLITSGSSFEKMFSDYSTETWCTIAEDGSYMVIDTNWLDIEDNFDLDAHDAIADINEKLGFSDSLLEKMGQTRSLDGRQTEENGKYTVTWTYHPDNGLEVMYEKN